MLKKVWALLFVFSIFSLISCKDDADEHDEEHFEPVEWLIQRNDVTIIQIKNGEITSEFNSNFILKVDELTEDYDLVFKDADGNIIEPHDDEYSLNWEMDEPEIAELRFEAGDEGEFEFKLLGKSAGQTNLTLKVMHGDHSDLISPKIPIIVE